MWHNCINLINKFGREQLNELYAKNKIEVRQGINSKVIKYEKKTTTQCSFS